MIKVQKQQKNSPITVIRAVSRDELANYEKNKLAGINERAQQNKIDVIRANITEDSIANKCVQIGQDTKTARINIGSLVFRSAVTADELDPSELFFIRCEAWR